MESDNSSNNNGIVVKIRGLDSNGFTYLATGDTESDRWAAIDRVFGTALKCDVLSAAHHGSKNGVHAGALLHMKPDTIIISCGVDNAYGHPDATALRAYARVARQVYATNMQGGVCLFTRRTGQASRHDRSAMATANALPRDGPELVNETKYEGDREELFDFLTDREARMFPMILILAPALLFVVVVYPNSILGEFPKNGVLASLFAITYLLSGVARVAGKAVQQRLFIAWVVHQQRACFGTAIGARRRNRNSASTLRCNECAQGYPGPLSTDEAGDPPAADAIYASAVGVLKARRRGEAHSLVLKENALYGFRRNMYGLKRTAIVVALFSAAAAVGLLIAQLHGLSPAVWLGRIVANPRYVLLASANVGIALCWSTWVRLPGGFTKRPAITPERY